MQTIIHRYLEKIDELNFIVEQIWGNDLQTAQKRFQDALIDAYIEGFAGVEYLLGVDITLNYENALQVVNQIYGEQSITEKFTDYFNTEDKASLYRLFESEFHRAYNTGALNGAIQSGQPIIKTWVTVRDDKVRETHAYLEGVSAPLDGYFYTADGDKALFPGGFEMAQNNANCRCILQYSAE